MKVYSLYYNDEFVASFPTKESATLYGKKTYGDDGGWSCNVIEEYLSKTPLVFTPPHYTSLNSMPCSSSDTKFVHNSQPNDPKPYFETYGGVKAEPYKDVRAYWEKK